MGDVIHFPVFQLHCAPSALEEVEVASKALKARPALKAQCHDANDEVEL